jgi:hypothetical protein
VKPILKLSQNFGQNLAEYSLAIGTVCLLSLGSLMTFGGSLRDLLPKMFPAPGASFTGNAPKEPVSPNTPAAPSSSASSTAGTSHLSITTSSGSTINVDNYPTDLPTTISTLGANGTTEVLSDTILKLAKQQLAAGAISQDQYNTLVALSNQGHYLGELAGAIQTAAANSTDGTTFNDTMVVIKGESVPIVSLNGMLGIKNENYNDPSTMTTDALNSKAAQPPLQQFNDLYQQALTSGALNDPVVKQVVKDAAAKIAQINTSMDYLAGGVSTEVVSATSSSDYLSGLLVHQNASTICTAGNASDTGVSCSTN